MPWRRRDGGATHGLVGGRALLVEARVLAEPEVDVPEQLLAAELGGLGVERRREHDVRVAVVEAAVLVLRPRHDLELLDAPDLEPDLRAAADPRVLLLGRALARVLVEVRADERHVRVLDRRAVAAALLLGPRRRRRAARAPRQDRRRDRRPMSVARAGVVVAERDAVLGCLGALHRRRRARADRRRLAAARADHRVAERDALLRRLGALHRCRRARCELRLRERGRLGELLGRELAHLRAARRRQGARTGDRCKRISQTPPK